MKSREAEKILEMRNLNVSFSKHKELIPAVVDFSLSLYRREVLGIVGRTGSGKSISMLALLGLLPSHAHRQVELLQWKGQDIAAFSKKQLRRICGKEFAYVYQEPSQAYDPLCNIFTSFQEAYTVHRPPLPKQEMEAIIISLLNEVGIQQAGQRLKNYFHQFSGGMIQRVQIALSLLHNPSLLIADEVSTSLDLITQKRIVTLLLKLCASRDMSLVFISHDIHLVSAIADRIVVLKDGRMVEEGECKKVLSSPRHEYTKLLIDSSIHFGDRYHKKSSKPAPKGGDKAAGKTAGKVEREKRE